MNSHEINDVRYISDFKGKTFSEYNKATVKKELIKNLLSGKIEQSCYWSAELICAGCYNDLWEVIIQFYTKYIHTANPKLCVYINLRLENYKNILTTGYIGQELRMRNNDKLRRLFAEIVCVFCESKKNYAYTDSDTKDIDINLEIMSEKLKATSTDFIDKIRLDEDPKELEIALNELGFNISSEAKDTMMSCFWIEWIIKYELLCKKNKQVLKCERRTFANVDNKYQMDVIWLIWDIFLNELKWNRKDDILLDKIVKSCLNIFCFNYTQSCLKKRKWMLYFIVELFTQPYPMEENIVKDKSKIKYATDNISTIYKQIKLNEHSPGTDYLYTNRTESNLDQTIAKLDALNSFEDLI